MNHVAIIMDGNRRWAEARGVSCFEGHRAGAERARDIITEAARSGVRYLTLYAFSTENWKRSASEVDAIFGLLEGFLRNEALALRRARIRLKVIGDISALPLALKTTINEAVRIASRGEGMELVLALNYGARSEIGRAVQTLLREKTHPQEICDETLSRLLSGERPDPDLVIRTGGERRLSNFLLWQSAYAELYFCDTPWPAFTATDFREALAWFHERQRRFGGDAVV